jgi:tetratricopeptide (TPR) repeat protein
MSQRNFSLSLGGATYQQNVKGVSPETLEAIVKAHGEHSRLQQKEIERLERELRLNTRQMRAALEIVGEAEISPRDYGSKLVEVAKRIKALPASPSIARTDSATLAALKTQARDAILVSDLKSADTLLEQIETEQSRQLADALAGTADTLDRRAEIAMARLRYRVAAEHWARAAALLSSDAKHAEARLDYLLKEVKALFLQGMEFGDSQALREVVERLRRLIEMHPRDRDPGVWATLHYELGRVLWRLGEREYGAERFEQAAAALREALSVRTRKHMPREWAWTQNELGNVLRVLGSRERKAEPLHQSATAYRAAMEIRTKTASPLDWAMGQSNLGAALRSLADIEGDPAQSRGAIAAYQAALGVWSRQKQPENWAMAQSNLGNAYHSLGAQERDLHSLEKSADAHRAALSVYTRVRYPYDWARTQVNLASVLKRQGEHEAGTKRYREAAHALRLALDVLTPEMDPFLRGKVQDMLNDTVAIIVTRDGSEYAQP